MPTRVILGFLILPAYSKDITEREKKLDLEFFSEETVSREWDKFVVIGRCFVRRYLEVR